MNKTEKYELIYLRSMWFFIILAVAHILFSMVKNPASNWKMQLIILGVIIIFNTIRSFHFKDNFAKDYYLIFRMAEPLLIAVSVHVLQLGSWPYIFLLFSILIMSFQGKRIFVRIFLASAMIVDFTMYLFERMVLNSAVFVPDRGFVVYCIYSFLFFSVLVLFTMIFRRVGEDIRQNEIKNKSLYIELEEKYDQLEVAQKEIKNQYEQMENNNEKMEQANEKLRERLGEFFTLQEITSAISSILDVSELLNHVNDIIIGVMGVSYSSILLMDEKKQKLRLNITNIVNKAELIELHDNSNCEIFRNILETGQLLMDNECTEEKYSFIKDRGVHSLICVPLSTKSRKFGIVLIEQKFENAFDENKLRLLDIIGKQVGVALENADLYQKMHIMATIDGLTGVYNRIYFQERLRSEIEKAEKAGYPLSLAIFDIDFFKKFNDKYGHLFGDKVLKSISQIVDSMLRKEDLIARFGGEEFVLVFPHTSLEDAFVKIEKIRKVIEETKVKDENVEASITASFGVSSYPDVSTTEGDLLKQADNALYAAKEAGRNCIFLANKK